MDVKSRQLKAIRALAGFPKKADYGYLRGPAPRRVTTYLERLHAYHNEAVMEQCNKPSIELLTVPVWLKLSKDGQTLSSIEDRWELKLPGCNKVDTLTKVSATKLN